MSDTNSLSGNQKIAVITVGILLIVLNILTGILGELMPDSFKGVVENYVGRENYSLVWTVILIAVVGVIIWLTMKNELQGSSYKIDYTDKLRLKIINSLLRQYKERHTQKLDDRIKLNLGLKYTKQGTESDYVNKFFSSGAKDEADLREKLVDILVKHKFLLIVGEAGAGKTTLLLDLAIELLNTSLTDKSQPIPFIFNLSSWSPSYEIFDNWLIDILVQSNGFSREFSKKMIAENLILPLLDGLDELGSNSNNKAYQTNLRNKCLLSFENYLSQKNLKQFVICSRINEYESITTNAPVNAEILVKNLNINQVLEVLKKTKEYPDEKNNYANLTAAANLIDLIHTNKEIKRIVCIPFYFNTLLQILSNRSKSYSFPHNEIELKDFIIKEFIIEKLTIKSNNYKIFSVLKYTRWLSLKLNEFGLTNFSLASFDEKDLKYNYSFRFYSVSLNTFFFFYPASNIDIYGVVLILSIWAFYWILNLGRLRLAPYQYIKFEFFGFHNFLKWLLIYLILHTFWMLTSIFFLKIENPFLILPLLAILFYLTTNLKIIPYRELTHPYQPFLKDLYVTLPFVILVLGWLAYIMGDIFVFLKIIGTFKNSISLLFLTLSFTSIYYHFILRIIFYFNDYLPFKLVLFFNFLVQRRILEYSSGEWHFKHKIIQDYFANMDIDQLKKEFHL